MNTTTLRRLLGETTARPLEGLSTAHADLVVELVNSADELLAENERLRAALIFIRDKEQAALNEAESLRLNIPEEAGCMEILHAAQAALKGKP